MITRYEIIKNDNEERLLLYLDYNYEFSKIPSEDKKTLEQRIIKYIKDNKILFSGTTITLIVGGIIIGNIYLKEPIENNKLEKQEIVEEINIVESEEKLVEEKEDKITDIEVKEEIKEEIVEKDISSKEEIDNNNSTEESPTTDNIDNNIYVTIRRSNGVYLTLELEEYIIGVVGYEMPASFNIEALKSQAVIARTYALKSLSINKTLTDDYTTQGYKSNVELQSLWQGNYQHYYNKIRDAVLSTKGEYLTYNGDYIDAVYHSTSNGKTESSSNVWGTYYPYLVSVDSSYDIVNPSFKKETFLSYQDITNKLNIPVDYNTNIEVASYTISNRAETIKIGENLIKGVDFRNKLGLRSTDIEIIKGENGIVFITKGYGHGVGLSQYGANGFANNGYTYKDILRHYYTGVMIIKK